MSRTKAAEVSIQAVSPVSTLGGAGAAGGCRRSAGAAAGGACCGRTIAGAIRSAPTTISRIEAFTICRVRTGVPPLSLEDRSERRICGSLHFCRKRLVDG